MEEQVKVLEEEQRKFMEELVSLRTSFISLDKTIQCPSELIVEPVPRTEGLRPLTETEDTSKNASPALLDV